MTYCTRLLNDILHKAMVGLLNDITQETMVELLKTTVTLVTDGV